MDVYIKEGRVYGLLKNRKTLKLTLDNVGPNLQIAFILTFARKSGRIAKAVGCQRRCFRHRDSLRLNNKKNRSEEQN